MDPQPHVPPTDLNTRIPAKRLVRHYLLAAILFVPLGMLIAVVDHDSSSPPLSIIACVVGFGGLLLFSIVKWIYEFRLRGQLIRLQNGRCPACNYDTRATPLLCPECGLVLPPNVAAWKLPVAARQAARYLLDAYRRSLAGHGNGTVVNLEGMTPEMAARLNAADTAMQEMGFHRLWDVQFQGRGSSTATFRIFQNEEGIESALQLYRNGQIVPQFQTELSDDTFVVTCRDALETLTIEDDSDPRFFLIVCPANATAQHMFGHHLRIVRSRLAGGVIHIVRHDSLESFNESECGQTAAMLSAASSPRFARSAPARQLVRSQARASQLLSYEILAAMAWQIRGESVTGRSASVDQEASPESRGDPAKLQQPD
jgi:hypothetical protein